MKSVETDEVTNFFKKEAVTFSDAEVYNDDDDDDSEQDKVDTNKILVVRRGLLWNTRKLT